MPDDIIISELSNAPQIDDSAVFPLTQDNGGSPATFKATMSQIAGKIGEGTTFANLHTTSKTLVGAINEAAQGGGGGIGNIISTASGSIATFADGGNGIPLKSCEVAIVAQQASGTPSPSNPLSISGFSAIAVADYAKYHRIIASSLTPQTQSGITITPKSNGVFEITGTTTGAVSINFEFDEFTVFSDDGRTININNDFASNSVTVIYRYGSTTIDTWTLSSINRTYTNFGLLSGKILNNLTIDIASGTTVNGTLKTEFLVNNTGTTHTVPLGQTIYGGTAELVGGNGYLTHICLNFSDIDFGQESSPTNHIFRGNYSGAFYSNIKFPPNASTPTTAITEHYAAMGYTPISASDNGKFALQDFETFARFVIIDNNFSTQADFETARNNDKIIIPLKNPIPITFTGANIPTLSGVNNVYADSGDVNELEYFNENADEIAELDRAIDYHNYSKGEHIVGRWIDGSTLYEKTFAVTQNLNSVTKVSLGSLVVDTLMFVSGYMKETTTGNVVPLSYYSSASDEFSAYYEASTNSIVVKQGWVGSGYITIKYTKATT